MDGWKGDIKHFSGGGKDVEGPTFPDPEVVLGQRAGARKADRPGEAARLSVAYLSWELQLRAVAAVILQVDGD